MAQRRMFSKKITESDQFLDMPMSAQCLYFHVNMNADDDGFVGNVKTIKRMIGSSDDDLRLLLNKEFLIPFESGVVVVKDWKIHNYIQKDRYQETFYKREKSLLDTDENKQYSLMDTKCIQNGYSSDTQVRLGKDRLGKDNNNTHDSRANDSDLEERFEKLWSLYPRKKGKANALKAYKKAVKSNVTDEQIEKGIKAYVQEIKNKRIQEQYIKYGSTWFNEHSWDDDYSIQSEQKPQTAEELFEGLFDEYDKQYQ